MVKLHAYGIRGKVLNWVENFLANRKQRVMVDEYSSDWTEVTSGVPQGSVLGPLLFVVYINDLPEICRNIFKLYADDSKILARVSKKDDLENLQDDLNGVSEWSDLWQTRLNGDKCRVLRFGKNIEELENSTLSIYDHDGIRRVMDFSAMEKDLGVLVCDDLSWKKHVETSAAKANSILGMLRKAFQHNSVELWKRLYVSYVRPHLEFAVSAWNPQKLGMSQLLEKVQRRATKIPKPLRQLSYEERLHQLGLEKLEQRRNRGDLIQFFKFYKGIEVVDWHCPLVSLEPSRGENGMETRGGNHRMKRQMFGSRQMNDHSAAVSTRLNFFLNRIIPYWNKLPVEVVAARSVNSFKAKLDKWTAEQRELRNNRQ